VNDVTFALNDGQSLVQGFVRYGFYRLGQLFLCMFVFCAGWITSDHRTVNQKLSEL